MIPLGGQAPNVLRARMWALNTCGEPTEIESTIRVLTGVMLPPPLSGYMVVAKTNENSDDENVDGFGFD